ncbi:MAG: photosynthetic reaction center cytochrome PufC [Janthinobacterium lividum]
MIPGLKLGLGVVGAAAAALLGIAMLSKFETPGQVRIQRGFRGVAMETNYNRADLVKYVAANKVPASLPQLPATGPKAAQVYKNVLVLGDLSVGQFTRLMVSLTNWVAPQQGCAYCHNTANMAEDTYYTKIVARRMIQMTQDINSTWAPHVWGVAAGGGNGVGNVGGAGTPGGAGVTCYTCHRGNNVPTYIWYKDPGPTPQKGGVLEVSQGKNLAKASVGDSSLPYDPFTPMLEGDYPIRQQGETPLPSGNRHSIKETEWTYALMIHFANSLGVNCTYCHNSRAFGDWSQSTPQRVSAWHGIRMVRDINTNYMDPLHDVFPVGRLGPTGDSPKVACATCHQGVFKPLYGVNMVNAFPELKQPGPQAGLVQTSLQVVNPGVYPAGARTTPPMRPTPVN